MLKGRLMPEFPVESRRMLMEATSVVNAVMEWGQDAQGKRFKTETQDRDPNTGMPKWGVEVFWRDSNFGEDFTMTGVVEVGAAEKPDPMPMTPVVFEGLELSIFKNQAGGLTQKWRAEAIADIQQRPGPKTDTESGTSGKDITSSSTPPSKSSRSSSAAA
jgi:hypothetical protein